ncbi:MAG: D-glycero-beta-D-manno-heptose 1-phosphate adenylyltransferase [Candidatus Aminicenantales bacterium]
MKERRPKQPPHQKVLSLEALIRVRQKLRQKGLRVVFTNGCFDILHVGHIRLFREAKKKGDILIAALNDDESVRRLKGPSRPVFTLAERLEILEAIEDIDYLTSFAEDTPQKIIASLLPDVLVKGGDWKPEEVVGRKEVEAAGGQVVIVPYQKGHSSSSIIRKVIRLSLEGKNR